MLYRRKASRRFGCAETSFEPLDFLARVLMRSRSQGLSYIAIGDARSEIVALETRPGKAWRVSDVTLGEGALH